MRLFEEILGWVVAACTVATLIMIVVFALMETGAL